MAIAELLERRKANILKLCKPIPHENLEKLLDMAKAILKDELDILIADLKEEYSSSCETVCKHWGKCYDAGKP